MQITANQWTQINWAHWQSEFTKTIDVPTLGVFQYINAHYEIIWPLYARDKLNGQKGGGRKRRILLFTRTPLISQFVPGKIVYYSKIVTSEIQIYTPVCLIL